MSIVIFPSSYFPWMGIPRVSRAPASYISPQHRLHDAVTKIADCENDISN
jgi:hypothetical protein